MSEGQTNFKKYDDWKAAGLARGLRGPFNVSGQLTLHQFVGDMGTEGMWNALSNSGFLFDPPQSDGTEP